MPKYNTSRLVALTFDDGPAQTTVPIIEALKANGAVATFFVSGDQLRRHTDVTEYAVRIGCEIGNHSHEHNDLTQLDYDGVLKQIEYNNELMISVTGKRPTIMRPPYGYYNDTVKRAARACGLALINWSVDPKDWDTDNAFMTRKRILSELEDGSVIVCHDSMASTATLMARFIPELKLIGYQLVTVSQLFEANNVKLVPGALYLSPNEVY